jgi:hypothetical protein
VPGPYALERIVDGQKAGGREGAAKRARCRAIGAPTARSTASDSSALRRMGWNPDSQIVNTWRMRRPPAPSGRRLKPNRSQAKIGLQWGSTNWNGVLVADLAAERTGLGRSERGALRLAPRRTQLRAGRGGAPYRKAGIAMAATRRRGQKDFCGRLIRPPPRLPSH